jgi:hypothetical protein
MTGKELLKMFEDGKKITIRFTETIEQLEGMFQRNMVADVLSIYKDGDELVLKVDQTKYYESNKQFDVPCWYNRDTGTYNLSYEDYCKQSNSKVHMTEEVYDDYEGELYNFTVIEDDTKELYEKYLKESENNTYIEWLENIILNKLKTI